MKRRELIALGRPDVQIGGLSLWVHGREFPGVQDFWDGNWLNVTALCEYGDSALRLQGCFLHLAEVQRLAEECEQLRASWEGVAVLQCMEPYLEVTLTARAKTELDVEISVAPDLDFENSHRFSDRLGRDDLTSIIQGCRSLLKGIPLRGRPE